MSNPRPVHAPMTGFPVVDGCLAIGGVSLTRLAARIGSTPFYAYSRDLLDRRIRTLRDALPRAIDLHYAVKANPMPAVVQHVARQVDGLDVASVAEMHVALDTGTPASGISFAGPGKTDAEIAQAVAAGITLNIESDREIAVAARAGAKLGIRPRMAVRVNPDFELKSSGMKMGGGPKQFGIDAERIPEVLAAIAAADIDFIGFHIFSGSQNLRADSICEAQRKAVDLAFRFVERLPAPIHMLNIGGGFGIPYFPGEQPLDLAPIGANLATLAAETAQRMPEAKLTIELGRYIVGEAGIYVCRVVDRKISRGEVYLVTDGGLHHHLAASGNFGQVIRKNYPVAIGSRMGAGPREIASVVGPLCTPLDLLADRMELAAADVGDLVVVYQSGAYGLTASPTAFLSHPRPAEVLV